MTPRSSLASSAGSVQQRSVMQASPAAAGAESGLPPRTSVSMADTSLRRAVPPSIRPRVTYLTARAISGHPVDGADLQRLVQADGLVFTVRQMLDKGRGNVSTDISDTAHESSRRTLAAMHLARALEAVIGTSSVVTFAVSAAAARAGTCDHFSALLLCLYTYLQAANDTTRSVVDQHFSHKWAVAHPSNAPPEHAAAIVMDAWAQGPAVFLSDASQLHTEGTRPLPPFTPSAVASCNKLFHKQVTHSSFRHVSEVVIPRHVQHMADSGETWAGTGGRVFDPINVIGEKFSSDVQASMANRGLSPVHLAQDAENRGAMVGVTMRKRVLEAAVNLRNLVAAEPALKDAWPAVVAQDHRAALNQHGDSLRDMLAAIWVLRQVARLDLRSAIHEAPAQLVRVRQLPEV